MHGVAAGGIERWRGEACGVEGEDGRVGILWQRVSVSKETVPWICRCVDRLCRELVIRRGVDDAAMLRTRGLKVPFPFS